MSVYRLTPAYKNYLWGGCRLKEKYGKDCNISPCAESWELSFHPDGLSTVNGVPLCDAVTPEQLGENALRTGGFPMLIKLIDAAQSLSVQVHPSDAYAIKNESSFGKTEMWYIIEADDSAGIYLGFSKKVTRHEVECAIKENTLCELLHFYPVKAGECYFIPAGTVHAIGAGCLICEIQQNSNLTYRVYDYNRRDASGALRELHIEKALEVARLDTYEHRALPGDLLGISKYFTTRRIEIRGERLIPACKRTFKTFTVVRGSGSLNDERLTTGDSFFIGADEDDITLRGDMDILLSEVRAYSIARESTARGVKLTLTDDLGRCIISREGACEDAVRKGLLDSVYITEDDIEQIQ